MSRIVLACVVVIWSAGVHAQERPSVVTFEVLDSPEGVPARGAPSRVWLLTAPTPVAASGGVGSVRPGAAWLSAPAGLDQALDRVAAVEQPVMDADAPGGLTAAVAVVRVRSRSTLGLAPPVQLALLTAPSVVAGEAADVGVAPLRSQGAAVLAEDGLEGWMVERCSVALDACELAGTVGSSDGVTMLRDAAPAGTWRWVARPLYSGGVTGPPSPASAPAVVLGPCEEPSALDATPGAQPLRVSRAGGMLAVSWEAMGVAWDLLGASGGGSPFSPLACALASPSWTGVDARPLAAYVAVARCDTRRSSLGRDSFGRERSGAACP